MQDASFIGSNNNISSIEELFDFTWLATVALASVDWRHQKHPLISSFDTSYHHVRQETG
jgi:hypothetical protein